MNVAPKQSIKIPGSSERGLFSIFHSSFSILLFRKKNGECRYSRCHVQCALLMAVIFIPGCSGPKSSPTSFRVDPQTAGVITGRALFAGKQPPRKRIDMDQEPQCAKLHAGAVYDDRISAGSDGALAHVFVYLKQGLEDKKFEPPAEPVIIDQRGCWFGPRVMGIQVGQTLKVTNSDPLTHNIHPLAQVNRDWNQSQAPGAEPLTRRFLQPEIMIRVRCNIHSWMQAWIGVVAHPWFAVTKADGSFELRHVPPGTYTIEAWQEELGRQEQQLTLAPAGKNEIVFRFED
jgi:plastocyanin